MTVEHNPLVPASPRCCIWLSGHWVSGPRYLALRTWVSGPRKLFILRSSYLFSVTFLCVHRHFFLAFSFPVTFVSVHRHFSLRPVVTDGQMHARKNPSVCPSVRADSAIESSPSYGRLIFFPSLFSASTATFLLRPVFPSLFSASIFSASTVTFLCFQWTQTDEPVRP